MKIITEAPSKRIGKVMPGIIYKTQTCIPGRNISYNVHNLIDIMKCTNTKNIQAAILFLDQENAFDRVNRDFLIKTLNQFNFGEYFTNWVKIMLKDITSQIKINGFLSEEIIIERGVRQGDPLSALLYIVVTEVPRNQIRSNQNIKGVSINCTEEKLFQYADDNNPIISDDNSLNELFKELEINQKATGRKVNVAKTKGLWVGKWKNREDKPFNIDWQNEKIEGLGIWLGNKGVDDLTFSTQLLKIKAKLKFWKPVKLSLIGKIKVLNIYIYSRLWHRTEFYDTPTYILSGLNRETTDFIWGNKKT